MVPVLLEMLPRHSLKPARLSSVLILFPNLGLLVLISHLWCQLLARFVKSKPVLAEVVPSSSSSCSFPFSVL